MPKIGSSVFITLLIIVIIRLHRKVQRGLSVYIMSAGHNREPHRNAKPMEVPLTVWTCVGPRDHALDGGWIPQGKVQLGARPIVKYREYPA